MTASDDLATLRASLDVLYHYTSDLANPPGEGRSAAWSSGKAAVRCVEAEIARLGEERDTLEKLLKEEQQTTDDSATQRYRAEAAEAEVARLRGGLREIATDSDQWCEYVLESTHHAITGRLERELSAAKEHGREASEMFVRANEQITELLQQESFMERKLAAQREDIERLAGRVEAAEAEVARLKKAILEERRWATGTAEHNDARSTLYKLAEDGAA